MDIELLVFSSSMLYIDPLFLHGQVREQKELEGVPEDDRNLAEKAVDKLRDKVTDHYRKSPVTSVQHAAFDMEPST